MWPEPKDIAYVFAAIIAGIFAYLVSLNSKLNTDKEIREKWLKDMKDSVSEFVKLTYECSKIKRRIYINKSKVGGGVGDLLEKKHNIFGDIKKSESYLVINLNFSESGAQEIKLKMDEVVTKLRVGDSYYNKSESDKFMGLQDELLSVSKSYFKSEWESIKVGDKRVNIGKEKCFIYLFFVVGLFSVYAIVYYMVLFRLGSIVG